MEVHGWGQYRYLKWINFSVQPDCFTKQIFARKKKSKRNELFQMNHLSNFNDMFQILINDFYPCKALLLNQIVQHHNLLCQTIRMQVLNV